jgi:beta-lysine 5,6-aminomutase alpha subunit
MSKLNLAPEKIARARSLAERIVAPQVAVFRTRSTVSIERACLRLLGIDGADADGVPFVNRFVDQLQLQGLIEQGALVPMAHAVLAYGRTPQQVAEGVAAGEVDLSKLPAVSPDAVRAEALRLCEAAMADLDERRSVRRRLRTSLTAPKTPWKYVIVATGNIFEDIPQAQAAARQGADIIAVIRHTGQSLIDYVPEGATTYGTGGTYATGENFRLMRAALDEVSHEVGRYVMLTNYASGLCMPEITALGARFGLDMMLNDAMYGILFRDINVQRTLLDQYFSRQVVARTGIIINTGEDNYLTTADAVEEGHTVLASQFINERFALAAGMQPDQMGLGHAYEIDPRLKHSFLFEVAMAQLVREVFPEAPLKFMPPTKHITGDVFAAYAHNTMFTLTTALTNQHIQLLGMLTEAIHTPFLSDRALALQAADYIYNAAADIDDEFTFKSGGIIQSRAQQVVDETLTLLERVADQGLLEAIANAVFADVSRQPDGGKGLSGVFTRSADYLNPFDTLIVPQLATAGG